MQHRRKPMNWQILRTWRGALSLVVMIGALATLIVSTAARMGFINSQFGEVVKGNSFAFTGLLFGVVGLGSGWKYPAAAGILRGTLLILCLGMLVRSGLAFLDIAHLSTDVLEPVIILLMIACLFLQNFSGTGQSRRERRGILPQAREEHSR